MSTRCRTVIRKWTCASQSAREKENNLEKERFSPSAWVQALNGHIDTGNQKYCEGVEMQIIKDPAASKIEENKSTSCDIIVEKVDCLLHDGSTLTRTSSNASSASSAAIPVPLRSLSRQSSLNCATSANDTRNTRDSKEGGSEISVNGTETLEEEEDPCFSPIQAASSQICSLPTADGSKVKEMHGSFVNEAIKCPISTSPNQKHEVGHSGDKHQASTASGFRSNASSGFHSGIPYSLSSKPRRSLTTALNRTCSSLGSPVQAGLRSHNHSKGKTESGDNMILTKSSEDQNLKDIHETATAPLSDPGYHSRIEFNHTCRCKPGCRCCFLQSPLIDSIRGSEECNKDTESLEKSCSSVETCDASTSPHLPLQCLCPRMSKSMEDLQHKDINPVRQVATKPSDKDQSKGPSQTDCEYDVFLACSSEDSDREWGLKLLNNLEGPPYYYQTYMYDRDHVLGRNIIDDRAKQIEKSFKFICLLSPNFLASSFCRKDLKMAHHEQVKNRPFSNFVIPLQIAPCNIPNSIQDVKHCEALSEGPNQYVINMVVRAIKDSK